MSVYKRGDRKLLRFDDPPDRLRGHEGFDGVGGEGAEVLGGGSIWGEGKEVEACERHGILGQIVIPLLLWRCLA